jgi:hypothetical protein
MTQGTHLAVVSEGAFVLSSFLATGTEEDVFRARRQAERSLWDWSSIYPSGELSIERIERMSGQGGWRFAR